MAAVQQRRAVPADRMRSSASPASKGKAGQVAKRKNYGSEGVEDNDIFLLPGSDFQLLGVLTLLAAVVRLFRIYQPTSVVFDEVQ